MWPRVFPFALYMGFIGVSSLIPEGSPLVIWLYPVKIVAVGGLLIYFWSQYQELERPVFGGLQQEMWAIAVGILVYLLWVRMDWGWAIQGEVTGYDPFRAGEGVAHFLAVIRIFGAVAVVPIMEELFWRSFLIRWVINQDFEKVTLGTFTIGSFSATVILFGLEHHLWFAGMMAGVAYNVLLYKTGRLWPCVISHATTNLILGIHVLTTEEWQWW